ncbi:MAG: SRPBCC family protein [Verrucomicrobiota bacterium]
MVPLRHLTFAASVLLAILSAHAEEVDVDSVENWIKTQEQWDALQKGEVVILNAQAPGESGDSDHSAMAAILIKAPVLSVWEVLNDHDRSPDYIKSLLSSDLKEENEDHSLLQQKVKVGFHKVSYVVKHIPEPHSVIHFERVSGDMKAMDGFWRFFPVGDEESTATVLIYRLSLKPDFPVPAFLIRKSLSDNLPDTLTSVRTEVYRKLDES